MSMGAAVLSWGLTHLQSFSPLCWIMWRLRWDLREKRRPQPSTGHWQGRCGHRDIAVRFHTRQPTLLNITVSIFHWMCLLRLRCAPSHAPSASTACWRWPRSCCGCSWRAAAGGRRRHFCCRARRSSSSSVKSSSFSSSSSDGSTSLWGKGAARVCSPYRLLAGLNWLIGGDTVSSWEWWSWLSRCSAQVWQPTFAAPNKSGHVERWERRQEKRRGSVNQHDKTRLPVQIR